MKPFSPVDHYEVLGIRSEASTREVRRAFRRRLLELHPDKCEGEPEPEALDAVMVAFEVLGDERRRESYDRTRAAHLRHASPLTSVPHVTDSDRPIDRARAIAFLLFEERSDEALERLREELDPLGFLATYLDEDELVDVFFLVGEIHEKRQEPFEGLRWYQAVLSLQRGRKRRRPCFAETLERVKRLMIHRIAGHVDPRTALLYLQRVTDLDLHRGEWAEVHKRRAQCYLALEQIEKARVELSQALALNPHMKGMQRLRERLMPR